MSAYFAKRTISEVDLEIEKKKEEIIVNRSELEKLLSEKAYYKLRSIVRFNYKESIGIQGKLDRDCLVAATPYMLSKIDDLEAKLDSLCLDNLQD
jgi:hypothetical protein